MGYQTTGAWCGHCDALCHQVSQWTLWCYHGSSYDQWHASEGETFQNTEIQRSNTISLWLLPGSQIFSYIRIKVCRLECQSDRNLVFVHQDAAAHEQLPQGGRVPLLSVSSCQCEPSSAAQPPTAHSSSGSTQGEALRSVDTVLWQVNNVGNCSGMVAFTLRNSEAAHKFISSLRLIKSAASLGSSHSLVCLPAKLTHQMCTQQATLSVSCIHTYYHEHCRREMRLGSLMDWSGSVWGWKMWRIFSRILKMPSI